MCMLASSMFLGVTPYGSGGGTSSATRFGQMYKTWFPDAAELTAAWNSIDVLPLH